MDILKLGAAIVAKTCEYGLLWWRNGTKSAGGRVRVGGMDESTFSRLLDRLPGTDMYETDTYPVYEWLLRDKHIVGQGEAVNWN